MRDPLRHRTTATTTPCLKYFFATNGENVGAKKLRKLKKRWVRFFLAEVSFNNFVDDGFDFFCCLDSFPARVDRLKFNLGADRIPKVAQTSGSGK